MNKYYIGDPCYVIKDSKWQAFVDTFYSSDEGQFEFEGCTCVAYNTEHGDGVYYDQVGREYGVDAGMIGLIPLELCVKDGLSLGHVVELDSFPAHSKHKGELSFGPITIDTDPQDEEEEEWFCEECGCEVEEGDDLCEECEEDV